MLILPYIEGDDHGQHHLSLLISACRYDRAFFDTQRRARGAHMKRRGMRVPLYALVRRLCSLSERSRHVAWPSLAEGGAERHCRSAWRRKAGNRSRRIITMPMPKRRQ
jgi:hypothetical protein